MCICVHCSLLRHNVYTGMGTNPKWTAQWILYMPTYINIARIKTLNIHSTQKAPLCPFWSVPAQTPGGKLFWLLSTLITFAYSWARLEGHKPHFPESLHLRVFLHAKSLQSVRFSPFLNNRMCHREGVFTFTCDSALARFHFLWLISLNSLF